jgi:hypothetical protein
VKLDERLRESLQRRAESVEPASGGWAEVTRRIDHRQRRSHTMRVSLVVGSSVAVVALAFAVISVSGPDTPDQNVAATGGGVATRPSTTLLSSTDPAVPADGSATTVFGQAAAGPGDLTGPSIAARPGGPNPATSRNYTPEAVWPETLVELETLQASVDDGHQPWRNDPVAVASAYLADRGLDSPTVGTAPDTADVDVRYAFPSMAGGRVHLSRLLDGSIYYVTGSRSDEISEFHVVRQGDQLAVELTARVAGNLVVRTKQPGSEWNDAARRTVVADQGVSLTVDGAESSALIVQVRLETDEGFDALAEYYLGASILGIDDSSLHDGSILRFGGVGPISLDMTLAEAERAAGVGMVTNAGEYCTTLATMGRPEQVSLVSTRGNDRVDVIIVAAPGVRTESGIGYGSTVDEVRDAYPGIEERLSDGRGRLVLRPDDPALAAYEMLFEVVDGTVASMWSGRAQLSNTDELCA